MFRRLLNDNKSYDQHILISISFPVYLSCYFATSASVTDGLEIALKVRQQQMEEICKIIGKIAIFHLSPIRYDIADISL